MKVILLSAALAISAMCTRAQQTDTAKLIVHYKFSHVRDTANRANPYRENMMLVVGKQSGVYRSYDRVLEFAGIKKQTQEAIARSGGGGITVNQHYTASGNKYYQFPNEKKLVQKQSLLFSNFLISGPLPVINWKTTGDTATFGGLHCEKATGHYKGRDYTAWFCPDLPLHIGPWELTGLPGVIVEAYDTKKEVCFMFNGIEKAGETDANAKPLPLPPGPGADEADIDPNLIKLPKDATKVTAKDFARLQETEQKDPAAFAQVVTAAAAQNGPAGDVKGPKIGFSSKSNARAMNNPIELPEKQ